MRRTPFGSIHEPFNIDRGPEYLPCRFGAKRHVRVALESVGSRRRLGVVVDLVVFLDKFLPRHDGWDVDHVICPVLHS